MRHIIFCLWGAHSQNLKQTPVPCLHPSNIGRIPSRTMVVAVVKNGRSDRPSGVSLAMDHATGVLIEMTAENSSNLIKGSFPIFVFPTIEISQYISWGH